MAQGMEELLGFIMNTRKIHYLLCFEIPFKRKKGMRNNDFENDSAIKRTFIVVNQEK